MTMTMRALTAREVMEGAAVYSLRKAPSRAADADYEALIDAIKEDAEAAGKEVFFFSDPAFKDTFYAGVSLDHPNVLITVDTYWKEITIGGREISWKLAGLKFVKAGLRNSGVKIR